MAHSVAGRSHVMKYHTLTLETFCILEHFADRRRRVFYSFEMSDIISCLYIDDRCVAHTFLPRKPWHIFLNLYNLCADLTAECCSSLNTVLNINKEERKTNCVYRDVEAPDVRDILDSSKPIGWLLRQFPDENEHEDNTHDAQKKKSEGCSMLGSHVHSSG